MIATIHVLIEVTDLKLYFQYNVFVAMLYCCFMYFLKFGLREMSLATIMILIILIVSTVYTFLGSNKYSYSCSIM